MPSQTSHLLPLPLKPGKCLIKSSTLACQSIFSQNQVFNFASSFQVSELPFQRNAVVTLPFITIPSRSSAICMFLLNLLLDPQPWPEESYELGSFCPFFCSFVLLSFCPDVFLGLFFFGTHHGFRGPCCVVPNRARFLGKKKYTCLPQKWAKWTKNSPKNRLFWIYWKI